MFNRHQMLASLVSGATALFGCVFGPTAFSADGQKAGWVLHQTGGYLGKTTTYISPIGVKLQSGNVTSIFRNSDKTVVMISEKRKEYCSMTEKEWMSQFTPPPTKADGRQISKGKVGAISGIKATQYLFSNVEHGKRRVTEEFWIADNAAIPARYTRTLAQITDLPAGFGAPLRIFKINKNDARMLALDTLACEQVPIKDDVFKSPTGYKRSKDQYNLMLGSDAGLK